MDHRAHFLPLVLALMVLGGLTALVFGQSVQDLLFGAGDVVPGAQTGDGLTATAGDATKPDAATGTGSAESPNADGENKEDKDPTFKDLDTFIKLGMTLITAFGAFVLAGRALVFGSASSAKFYYDLSADPMKRITRLFRALVRLTKMPVCVFIDDLDRCNADFVVDLLEGIQTSFRARNVVYVVAADRNWIRSAFEKRYGSFSDHVGDGGQPLGYLFLEKLFQMSTPLPGMGKSTRESYWKGLINDTPSTPAAAPEEQEPPAGTNDNPDEAETLWGKVKDTLKFASREIKQDVRQELMTRLNQDILDV